MAEIMKDRNVQDHEASYIDGILLVKVRIGKLLPL